MADMYAPDLTLITDIFANLSILGDSGLLTVMLSFVICFLITRDIKKWEVLHFPVLATIWFMGMPTSALVWLVATLSAIMFATETQALQVVRSMAKGITLKRIETGGQKLSVGKVAKLALSPFGGAVIDSETLTTKIHKAKQTRKSDLRQDISDLQRVKEEEQKKQDGITALFRKKAEKMSEQANQKGSLFIPPTKKDKEYIKSRKVSAGNYDSLLREINERKNIKKKEPKELKLLRNIKKELADRKREEEFLKRLRRLSK